MAIHTSKETHTSFEMEGDVGAVIRAKVEGGIATVAIGDKAEVKTSGNADVSEMFTESEAREAAKLFTKLADEIKAKDNTNS